MSEARDRDEVRQVLRELARRLESEDVHLVFEAPGVEPVALGAPPPRTRVVFHTLEAALRLRGPDLPGLASDHLAGRIDFDGDLLQVLRLHGHLDRKPTRWERAYYAAKLLLRDRAAYNRESIAFHYERPAEFFLPWFERWRSYSHGFYETRDDDPAAAQARKLQYAIDALGLEPGMRVLDVGGGWGCFVEYAGLQGIEVHALTLSEEQRRFTTRLIEDRNLPCRMEFADFFDFQPEEPYDAAVLLGSLEHLARYPEVAARLRELVRPEGGVYADFCARRDFQPMWGFVKRYIYTGPTAFVSLARLSAALLGEGFTIHRLGDDSLSYAWTVRDWARALEANRKQVAEVGGEPSVRAFLLWLWGSYESFLAGGTQAHHLVASLRPTWNE